MASQQEYGQQQIAGAYGQGVSGHPPAQSDSGAFQGGSYNITHRDTNAVLNIDLQQGGTVRSKSGAMIHMSGTIEISGKVKFSMKKLFTGGEMSESTYAGHGKVALGPTLFGDIITIHVDPRQQWTIGKDAFLACTSAVSKDTKAQGLGKAMFSGEDLFIYKVGGEGIMWLTSFGAVDRLDVSPSYRLSSRFVCWTLTLRCDCSSSRANSTSSTTVTSSRGHAIIKSKRLVEAPCRR